MKFLLVLEAVLVGPRRARHESYSEVIHYPSPRIESQRCDSRVSYHNRSVPGLSTIEMSPGFDFTMLGKKLEFSFAASLVARNEGRRCVIRDPKHFARTSVPCLWPKANCEAIICASEQQFTLHQKAILVAKTRPACRHVTLSTTLPTALETQLDCPSTHIAEASP